MEDYKLFYNSAIAEARDIVRSLKQVIVGIYETENPFIFLEEDENESLVINSDALEPMSATQVSLEMFKLSNITTRINRRLSEFEVVLKTMIEERENYKEQYMKEGSKKVTEKRAEIKTSETYMNLNYNILKVENICKLLKTAVDNYDRIYAALSRHLAALQNDMDKDNRNDGKPNKASFAQPSLKGNPSNGKGKRIST